MHSSEDGPGVLDRSVLVVRLSPSRWCGCVRRRETTERFQRRGRTFLWGNSHGSVLVLAEQLGGL